MSVLWSFGDACVGRVARALLYMADVWSVAGLLNEMHARVCAALVIELFLKGCFYGHCTDGGYTILLIAFIFCWTFFCLGWIESSVQKKHVQTCRLDWLVKFVYHLCTTPCALLTTPGILPYQYESDFAIAQDSALTTASETGIRSFCGHDVVFALRFTGFSSLHGEHACMHR